MTFEQSLQQCNPSASETEVELFSGEKITVKTYTGQFFTERQRHGHSLHEVPYFACFKPDLPDFFIESLTEVGDTVYDPFMGRGTTVLEAALLGRVPRGNDANPLNILLIHPRLNPPTLAQVQDRLASINADQKFDYDELPTNLLLFFHLLTLKKLCTLKKYFLSRERDKSLDFVDRWIRLTVLARLTGHSPGFFSRYSLPPNLAAKDAVQRNTNKLAYLFSTEEITDPDSLAQRLLRPNPSDSVAIFLSQNLPPKISVLHSAFSAACGELRKRKKTALRKALARHLNSIIQGERIFDPDIFPEEKLSKRTQRLLRRRLKGVPLHYLNRKVLLDVLPNELEHRQDLKQQHRAREKSVASIVMDKTKELRSDCTETDLKNLRVASERAGLIAGPADDTPAIPSNSVSLVVTSPPFLKVVDYAKETRLRRWFADITLAKHTITTANVAKWEGTMTAVMRELYRVVKPGGHVAFEVGEVHKGRVELEKAAVRCGVGAGFEPLLIMINSHSFSKTTNINGGEDSEYGKKRGTNTNRIVVFRKPQ